MRFAIPILNLILGGLAGYFLSPEADIPGTPDKTITLRGLSSVTGNEFSFATVIQETCGVRILPVSEAHLELMTFLPEAAARVSAKMSESDSPAREKRRINEVSALFEEALLAEIDAHRDFTCTFPKTKDGSMQRSGYPDLRVEHLPSGTVAYLDPKLFEATSIKSSFRTFYYEPSETNLKVTEDALHLLIGFPHDGKTREWTFGTPELVDLANLTVGLKTEFSASNKDLYRHESNR